MSKIAIFGTGIDGRRLHRFLRKKININYFFDSDPKLHKKNFFKVPVYTPKKSKDILNKTETIYLGGRYMDEQHEYLKSLKYKGKIIRTERWKVKPSKKELEIREKKLLKLLKDLIKIFDENNINYFVDASSLLALFRKQKLSEFTDVDIAIPNNNLYILQKLVKKKIKNCKIEFNYFKFKNFLIKKNSLIQIVLTSNCNLYNREPASIEFYNQTLHKKNYVRYIPGNLIEKIPKKFRTEIKIVKYHKLKLKVTKYHNSCLNYFYGKNWRNRDKNWKNQKSKKRFIDLHNFK